MDQLGYIKETWGLSGERANEIIRFADNKIRTNENWVRKVRENSEEKNRDFDTQILREAKWMLYNNKPDCKYCVKKGGMAMINFTSTDYWTGVAVGVAGLLLYQNYIRPALKNR